MSTNFFRRAHFFLSETVPEDSNYYQNSDDDEGDEDSPAGDNNNNDNNKSKCVFQSQFIFATRQILNVVTPHIFGYFTDEEDEPDASLKWRCSDSPSMSSKTVAALPPYFDLCRNFSPSTLQFAKTFLLCPQFISLKPEDIPFARRLVILDFISKYYCHFSTSTTKAAKTVNDFFKKLRFVEEIWIETNSSIRSAAGLHSVQFYMNLLAPSSSASHLQSNTLANLKSLVLSGDSLSFLLDDYHPKNNKENFEKHLSDEEKSFILKLEKIDEDKLYLENLLFDHTLLLGSDEESPSSSSSSVSSSTSTKSLGKLQTLNMSSSSGTGLNDQILKPISDRCGKTLLNLTFRGDFKDHAEEELGEAFGRFENLRCLSFNVENELPPFDFNKLFKTMLISSPTIQGTLRVLDLYLWGGFNDAATGKTNGFDCLSELYFLDTLIISGGLWMMKDADLVEDLGNMLLPPKSMVRKLKLSLAIFHPLGRENEFVTEEGLTNMFRKITNHIDHDEKEQGYTADNSDDNDVSARNYSLRELDLNLSGRRKVTGETFVKNLPPSIRSLTLKYDGREDWNKKNVESRELLFANVKKGIAHVEEKYGKDQFWLNEFSLLGAEDN